MRILKFWVLSIVIIVLLIPTVQQIFAPFTIYDVNGIYEKFEKPDLKLAALLDKSFQEQFEKHYHQNFGFRNIFVRTRNEVDWRVFNQINASKVLAGKDDYLYERGYLYSYLGTDYVGDSAMQVKVKRLKSTSQYFADRGVPFLIVIAPGKGWYYPDKLPKPFLGRNRNKTNYEGLVTGFQIENVPFIDFNKEFLNLKDSLGVLIYPKTGIHWSSFGAALAFDSIVSYARKKFDINIPQYEIQGINELKTTITKGDNDLEKLMNLLVKMDNFKMIYPDYKVDPSANKPSVLAIGDSFFYAIERYAVKAFDLDYFYYYKLDKTKLDDNFTTDFDVWIGRYDMIVLLGTEAGIHSFPWGFLDDMDSTVAAHKAIDSE